MKDFPRAVPLDEARPDTSAPPAAPETPVPEPTRGWVRTLARAIWMIILTAGVLFGGYAGQQYLIATKKEPPKRPAQEKVAVVSAIPVTFGDYRPTLKLYGETVAGRRVELRSLVSGEVKSVGDGLRDGGTVNAGDPLLTIDPFNFEGAVAETTAALAEAKGRLNELEATRKSERDALKRDREQLAIADKDVKKTQALVKRRAVSERLLDERELVLSQRRQAVEQRTNNLTVQAARIEQQKASIDRLNWSLRQAERRLKETRLVAPFNAYVTDVNADVGRMLGATDRVATLLDQDWIEARFVMTDQQYGRIVAAAKDDGAPLIGRKVDVIWRVGQEPITYAASIVRVGATIEAGQGGVALFARLASPTAPVAIRPGAFVEVQSPDRQYQKVARLPQTALYDNKTVYVIKDGRLDARAVEAIGADGRHVLVRSDELTVGDRVVTTRLAAIGSGLRVSEK